MFGLFKTRRQLAEEYMEAVNGEPIKIPSKDKTAYSVGKTEQGKTTLSIGMDGYTYTLTMTDAGCRQLIRMLEAAMDDEEDQNA